MHAHGLRNVDQLATQTPHAVSLRFSEELCRGGALAESPAAIRRILLIGDSFTEGQGVREEQTFPAILQARQQDWLLMNCARRGYDFPRLTEWMDEHLSLAPSLVVYAMVLNDPEQSQAFRAQQHFLNDWILDRRNTVERMEVMSPWTLRLPLLVRDRIESARVAAETTRWNNDMTGAPNRDGWQRTLQHLEHMQRSGRHTARSSWWCCGRCSRNSSTILLLVKYQASYATCERTALLSKTRCQRFVDNVLKRCGCIRLIITRTLWRNGSLPMPSEPFLEREFGAPMKAKQARKAKLFLTLVVVVG